jgi:hypothetical protein
VIYLGRNVGREGGRDARRWVGWVRHDAQGKKGELIESYHHARDRAQEHRIGRKVRRKPVAALEQVPRENANPHNRRYIASAADVLLRRCVFRARLTHEALIRTI